MPHTKFSTLTQNRNFRYKVIYKYATQQVTLWYDEPPVIPQITATVTVSQFSTHIHNRTVSRVEHEIIAGSETHSANIEITVHLS